MIEISIVIAIGMAIAPGISNLLNIPKKLRSWTSLLVIIILNILNTLIFGDQQVLEAIKIGIESGIIAVGIYSTGKNTVEYVSQKNYNNKE